MSTFQCVPRKWLTISGGLRCFDRAWSKGPREQRKPRSDRERNPMPDRRRDNGPRLRAYVIAQSARGSRVSTTARGRECLHHVGLHARAAGGVPMGSRHWWRPRKALELRMLIQGKHVTSDAARLYIRGHHEQNPGCQEGAEESRHQNAQGKEGGKETEKRDDEAAVIVSGASAVEVRNSANDVRSLEGDQS